MTKVLKKENLNEIKEALLAGEVIAFPTETVYGLGVISTSKECFDKLVKVKHRSPEKPFTLMISSLKQIENLAELNYFSKKLIEKYFPGPITLILKAKKNIPEYYDLGSGYIGIRMPDDEFVLKMIESVGVPLLVPSANPSNLKPATNVEEVLKYFNEKIYGVVEGKIKSNIPSTIIKISDDGKIELIREGELKFKDILEDLK